MAAGKVVKYSLLAFPMASCGLGYWQLRRLEWKKGLIADLEGQMREEPRELMELIKSAGGKNLDHLEYRRIMARGQYDPDPKHQLYLKPRQLVVNEEAVLRGRSAHASNIGVNVITPFQLEGTETRVLVNRGWLASRGKDNVDEHAHLGLGTTKDGEGKEARLITGVLRKSAKHTTYGVNNDETLQEWHVRDVEAMARRLNTAPVMLDLDPDPKRVEGPIAGQTQLNVRNEHLNYAITWFALAVFSWMMWYTKYGKRSLYGNTKFGHR